MAGYALARLRFPGREVIFLAMFSTFLVSLPVIIVPLFILVRALGMLNSYAGLIIPSIFNAFGIFLLRQFYLSVPARARGGGADRRRGLLADLLEHHPAAQPPDPLGAGDPVLSRQLERLPLAADGHPRPEPLAGAGRRSRASARSTPRPWNYIMAASTIVALPMLVLFVIFQRQIMESIKTSGLK